ncbi:MAG: hypothetical protein U9R11_05420 [Chloroflexota bacterium]|nr:hypothetical protein [Chloroflexota bacterium]
MNHLLVQMGEKTENPPYIATIVVAALRPRLRDGTEDILYVVVRQFRS